MKFIFRKPYIFIFLISFFGFLVLDIFVSGFNKTALLLYYSAGSADWVKLSISFFLTLVISLLIAINATYLYAKYKSHKVLKEASILSSVGVIGGLATGVCSSCVTGLFPFIFGLFGVTFTWAFLPFGGVEIQLLVILLLSYSLYQMRK
jgi:hypothetical protein